MECYLCGNENFILRSNGVRDADHINVLECKSCSLVQLDDREHITNEHYANSGMHGESAPSIKDMLKHASTDDERRFNQLRELIKNANLLDFGCGNAGFLSLSKSLARSVTGVDPEKRVVEHYEKTDLEILQSISDIKKKDIKFDIITSFHVFEHLHDPITTLTSLRPLLSQNGTVVIEVPNADDALIKLFGSDYFKKFTYWSQHLFLYNSHTLDKVCHKAGFQVQSVLQYQRYPLSNHLHWLSYGKPGGHEKWSFLDDDILKSAYANSLARIGQCDTIIAFLKLSDIKIKERK